MKQCPKCGGERLPWHTSYCRECYNELDRRRYYANRKKRLLLAKKRYERLKSTAWLKERYEKAKRRSPQKWKARQDLRNAITQGKVKKLPCEVCGKKKVHGHHTDYSKPFQVSWLCKDHHYERHRKYNELGRTV